MRVSKVEFGIDTEEELMRLRDSEFGFEVSA